MILSDGEPASSGCFPLAGVMVLSTGLAPIWHYSWMWRSGPETGEASRQWLVPAERPAVFPDGLEPMLALMAGRSHFAGGDSRSMAEARPGKQNVEDNGASAILLPRIYLRRKQQFSQGSETWL